MNSNSYLSRYLSEHENWRTSLVDDYDISIKEKDGYAIFNYGIKADFRHPLVKEARGIIIDTETLDVVCWPFRKFGSWDESYADTIDWSTARVQSKIDGSIIKLWYSVKKNSWVFSTNAMIYAEDALADRDTSTSYWDVIKMASNYRDIIFSSLNKDTTYIFELVSPITQVIVPYEKTKLYHIGTRNNITGVESISKIGIERPMEYDIFSLEACVTIAENLNNQGANLSLLDKEGFVVVDANWNRIKVKSPDYVMLHHLSSNESFPKERLLSLLRAGRFDTGAMCKQFPKFAHYFKYYDYKVEELTYQVNSFCEMAKRFYERNDKDLGKLGRQIGSHRYSVFAFQCIKKDKTAYEALEEMKISTYAKYIPDYAPERLGLAFKEVTDE